MEQQHDERYKVGLHAYNMGCRCEDCKLKRWIYVETKKVEFAERNGLPPRAGSPHQPLHGKLHSYNMGCRCEPCKEAASAKRKELRKNAKVRYAMVNHEAVVKWAFALWKKNQSEAIMNPKFRKLIENGIIKL